MKALKSIIAALCILCLTVITASSVFADVPPPPPGGGHGSGGNQVPGGGAPVGEGLLILTGLGIGYALKKIRKERQNALVNEL